jgi:hypothetical protein
VTDHRDHNPASADPKLENWLSTFVGMLDSAFSLTDDEVFEVRRITARLLSALNVENRGQAHAVPLVLRQEMLSGHYSDSMDRLTPPAVRPVGANDCVASVAAWTTALEYMLASAYPDFSGDEMLLMRKVLTDLLTAIGVPDRAASFFPEAVMAAHREIVESVPE